MNINLVDFFWFADQEKVLYSLGYTLTLKHNNNNNVILRGAGVDAAKVDKKINRLAFATIYTYLRKPRDYDGSVTE